MLELQKDILVLNFVVNKFDTVLIEIVIFNPQNTI